MFGSPIDRLAVRMRDCRSIQLGGSGTPPPRPPNWWGRPQVMRHINYPVERGCVKLGTTLIRGNLFEIVFSFKKRES